MTNKNQLPMAQRSDADLPGHWLLARLGKRVLRPGGLELTTRLLTSARINDADVVELGPGLGRTAADIAALRPRSYVGIDANSVPSAPLQKVVAATGGRLVDADAADTGLPAGSADVVIGEAMLTMQGDGAKKAIVEEAYRVLRPGGRYAIHELGLMPDDLADGVKDDIRRDMARAIKVNARPLTVAEWTTLLTGAGFAVHSVDRAPMALLQPRRVIADEGPLGALRIVANVAAHPAARTRVRHMRATFRRYRGQLTAVAIVAVK